MSAALQKYDKNILKLLQADCAQSVADIARQVGLSTSPCWRRIAQMEEAGIIRKRVAVLDHARLGMEVVAFVTVRLSQHGRENLEQFEAEIRRFPEVLECYTVTGEADYILKIVTRDIRHFEAFLRNHLMLMPMIRETHSTIAVTEIEVLSLAGRRGRVPDGAAFPAGHGQAGGGFRGPEGSETVVRRRMQER